MTERHSPKIFFFHHEVHVDKERCTMVFMKYRGNIRVDVFGGDKPPAAFYDVPADIRVVP